MINMGNDGKISNILYVCHSVGYLQDDEWAALQNPRELAIGLLTHINTGFELPVVKVILPLITSTSKINPRFYLTLGVWVTFQRISMAKNSGAPLLLINIGTHLPFFCCFITLTKLASFNIG